MFRALERTSLDTPSVKNLIWSNPARCLNDDSDGVCGIPLRADLIVRRPTL